MISRISKTKRPEKPTYNIELYEKIINQFPTLNLIASGGVSSLDDLIELEEIGCSAAIVGKAIYENKITINDLANFN